MTRKFEPRPVRLTLRLNQAPVFRLRLEQSQGRHLLEGFRLLRAGVAEVLGTAPEQVRDSDLVDCLCALVEQEFGHLRQE